jgi:hypothetical protein
MMVRGGAGWCRAVGGWRHREVHDGVGWCRVVQGGAGWCGWWKAAQGGA